MREPNQLEQLDTTALQRLSDAREAAAMVASAVRLFAILSPRQRELVGCLRAGLTVAQAAECMRIRRGTAWGYWRRVRVKVARLARSEETGGPVAAPRRRAESA